jgi:hypothetical protein
MRPGHAKVSLKASPLAPDAATDDEAIPRFKTRASEIELLTGAREDRHCGPVERVGRSGQKFIETLAHEDEDLAAKFTAFIIQRPSYHGG